MKSICKKMISMLVAFALITGFVQVLPDAEAATKPTLTASASVNQGSATTLMDARHDYCKLDYHDGCT